MRAPQRQYARCEQEPRKERPKSRKLLWGTIGATVLTGAAVVYAKYELFNKFLDTNNIFIQL